jgi:hypothetical protein
MIMKSVFAAAAIAGAVALGNVSAAHADPQVNVGIGLNFGDAGYSDYNGYDGNVGNYDNVYDDGDAPWRYRRHHLRWDDQFRYRISCAQGRNIVARSGFRGVAIRDCSGPVYRYTAWKRGEQFRIAVNMRGRIVAVNPIY